MASSDPAANRPAGMCMGAGHLVVYGNPAFVERFGPHCLGMPAREVMLGVPEAAFVAFDAALTNGRAVARWVTIDDEEWRVTVRPRVDPETDEVFGVAFHLRLRADEPPAAG
jgi:hypothetical protein